MSYNCDVIFQQNMQAIKSDLFDVWDWNWYLATNNEREKYSGVFCFVLFVVVKASIIAGIVLFIIATNIPAVIEH